MYNSIFFVLSKYVIDLNGRLAHSHRCLFLSQCNRSSTVIRRRLLRFVVALLSVTRICWDEDSRPVQNPFLVDFLRALERPRRQFLSTCVRVLHCSSLSSSLSCPALPSSIGGTDTTWAVISSPYRVSLLSTSRVHTACSVRRRRHAQSPALTAGSNRSCLIANTIVYRLIITMNMISISIIIV